MNSKINNSDHNYRTTSSFSRQNRRRTTSLTFNFHEESYDYFSLLFNVFSFVLFFKSEIDELDFELDDDDIDKILIITPTPPSNRKQHQKNHDRSIEYTPRARMTAEIAKIIDDGLRWYEEELWHDRTTSVIVRYLLMFNVCLV